MNQDTQAVLSALKVYEQTLRNDAKDKIAYADILANAASLLLGTLVTQLTELETTKTALASANDNLSRANTTIAARDRQVADLSTQLDSALLLAAPVAAPLSPGP